MDDNSFTSQFQLMRSFNRSARLFLLATFINGIVYSIWWLFFNFYILELGYSREFLGLVTSVTSASALLLGIPLGLLSDRIGRRKAMLWGVAFYVAASGLEVVFLNPNLILLTAFIGGAGHMLYFISQPPFMMKSSTGENRTLLFSLNFALITLSGTFGNYFAGQMPAFFGSMFGVPAISAEAYRIVLLFAVGLGSFTLLPLAMIRTNRNSAQNQDETTEPEQQSLSTMLQSLRETLLRPITYKLSFPNLLIGFGAAILIPYMNIYFRNQYNTSDQTLGIIFSLSSLLIGIGAFIGPRLALSMDSKIKAIVLTQWLSIVFLLILGFSPFYGLAAFAFLMRSALMNMSVPLYDAFSMEQVREKEQATVVSIKETAWQLGWTVGPYISGVVQETYGFDPLFITTAVMYGIAILIIWVLFRDSEKPLKRKPEYTMP
jgi:MFS family permease